MSKRSPTNRDIVGFNSGYGSRINFNGLVRFTTFAPYFLKMPGIDQQSALAYDKYVTSAQSCHNDGKYFH